MAPRIVSWLALIAALSTVQERAAPPQFPSSVEQVVVDAVVLDAKGAAVAGLSREDFVVAEDGKPQAIATFEAVETRAAPAGAASRSRVATNSAPASPVPRRTIAIVFDDLGLDPAAGERARAALGDFVRTEIVAGDRVSLLSTTGRDRWVADTREEIEDLLDVLARVRGLATPDSSADLMSEAEACRIQSLRDAHAAAVVAERYRAAGVPLGREVEHLVNADARTACQRATARARQVLGALERSARALQGIRGRKAVVLVSPGVLLDAGMPEYGRTREACREANAAVYFLAAAGLEAPPTSLAVSPTAAFRALGGERPPAEDGTDQESLAGAFSAPDRDAAAVAASLADETGGFTVRNTNDLAGGLARIARDVRAYYLLGYVPTNPARDGKYRRIAVRLSSRGASREGWEVRARRGYSPAGAPPAPVPGGSPEELLRVADSPVDRGDVPLRLAAYALEDSAKTPGTIRCVLVAEVDASGLAPAREGGRPGEAGLDLVWETLPRAGGPGERVVKRVKPKAEESKGSLAVSQEMALPPGIHRVTVAARDVASGRSGSVSVRLDVPPTGVLRVSRPTLSASGAGGATDRSRTSRLGPLEFGPADSLQVAFVVYGARADPGTGEQKLSVSYAVVPAGNEEAAAGATFTRLAGAATGSLQRIGNLRLAGLAPGPYLFVGRVADEEAGRQVTFTEPFAVTSAPPAASTAPAGADPELTTLLEQAGRYVVDYESAFHDVAAEEDYSQRAPNTERSGPDWIRTRADIVFARLAPPFPWATFRDVFEVNGSAVRDRDGRLERAFRESPATAVARAEAILSESTRYNLGPERTVNLPTLALLILHPANQPRFAFERRAKKDAGPIEVAFREQGRPTIFREFTDSRRQVEPGSSRPTQRGADLPAEGRFWLDRRGTVLRSEVRFHMVFDATATITTTYRAEPALAMWVPEEMKERYEGGLFGTGTDAVARYSRFRKFEVTVEQGGARVAPP